MIKNLFTPSSAIAGGGAVRLSDGGIDATVTSYSLSTFVNITGCTQIACNIPSYGSDPTVTQGQYGIGFYRADDTFISSLPGQLAYTPVAVPSGAAYVQFGWLTSSLSATSVVVYELFGGATILSLPFQPGIKSIELGWNDTVAKSTSPFTGQTQVQSWPGADGWNANIALPQMVAADAANYSAFLGQCRGMANVFYLSHPQYRQPTGTPQGTPVANGVNAAMSTYLNTRGWKASTRGHLLPGDYLQLGHRLHQVINTVSSDENGQAIIELFPSIREATADGDAIKLNNPQGLFRLASNSRSILSDETLLTGISLKCVEAR